jgi:hypothetical protein
VDVETAGNALITALSEIDAEALISAAARTLDLPTVRSTIPSDSLSAPMRSSGGADGAAADADADADAVPDTDPPRASTFVV